MLKSSRSDNENLKELDKIYDGRRSIKELEEKLYWEDVEERYDAETEDNEVIKILKEVYHKQNEDDEVIRNMKEFKFTQIFRRLTKNIDGNTCEDMLGIKPATFSKFKRGHQFPSDDMMKKLSKKLFVSVKYLIGENDIKSCKAEEINKITGLSEKALKILFMLNHNIVECEELTDEVPKCDTHRNKLNAFNSLIEDNVNFIKFLSCLERYTNLKKKTKNINKEENKKEYEELELQLLGAKGELISILFNSLENIN